MAALLPSDAVLVGGLLEAAAKAQSKFPDRDVLLLSSIQTVDQFPYTLANTSNTDKKWEPLGDDKPEALSAQDVAKELKLIDSGLKRSRSLEVIVWSRPQRGVLRATPVPPFSSGSSSSVGQWLGFAAVCENGRTVIDTSKAVLALRSAPAGSKNKGMSRFDEQKKQKGGRRLLEKGEGRKAKADGSGKTGRKGGTDVDQAGNRYLALSEWPGSVAGASGATGGPQAWKAPFHVKACHDPEAGKGGPWDDLCVSERHADTVDTCLPPVLVDTASNGTTNKLRAEKQLALRTETMKLAKERKDVLSFVRRPPHTLEYLLPLLADENKTIVLVAVSGHYVDMLMNFVCQLRTFGIRGPLIAALDVHMFEFALSQGLPVYLSTLPSVNASDPDKLTEGIEDCWFYSSCFKSVSKGKSKATLQVLKLGYNVMFSDVDIVWFKNPLPHLSSFGPGVLPIQSDNGNASLTTNMHGSLNSGFYFARAEPIVISSFEAVIEAAAIGTNYTEQYWFNMILCEFGQWRVGDNECVYKANGLRIVLLEREKFPNGGFLDIWKQEDNVRNVCDKLGCFVLHNNFIAGHNEKVGRLQKNGFWVYEDSKRMCLIQKNVEEESRQKSKEIDVLKMSLS
eukprot:TRINITY_DN949_c0_g1_i1.p1 TRINITY_DN949_c0_g1~~TRINITY_DN949_c0_g1_i1.p1  ORF type:complete len:685 (+),score=65.97 TRINITY_DN949_c0_g1_i1:188-2056(+)